MNSAIKTVVALLVVALIAVIGMIMIVNQDASEPKADAATVMTTVPDATTVTEVTPEESDKPEVTAENSGTGADDEAQDDAQDTMYEGALAGLSEEEIGKMALAEEQSHGTGEDLTDDGEEDAGD